jgi:hypothetical protein
LEDTVGTLSGEVQNAVIDAATALDKATRAESLAVTSNTAIDDIYNELAEKQNKLTASTGITIGTDNKISVKDNYIKTRI